MGPLVACCYATSNKSRSEFRDLGVVDSKRLTGRQRESLFPELLRRAVSIHWTFLSPPAIDGENLNALYTRHVIHLIRLSPAVRVVVDAPVPSSGLNRYRQELQAFCGDVEVEAYNGAEDRDPAVAAASICAKVVRDRVLARLAQRFGSVGSGYPSDPATVSWLDRKSVV